LGRGRKVRQVPSARWRTFMKNVLPTVLCLFLSISSSLSGQSKTVFHGVPEIKITEGGYDRLAVGLKPAEAINIACIVSQIGGEYYWASRENKELGRRQSGAFITYTALDGAGYIRVIAPGYKESASLMSDAEAKYDYVEHLIVGLRTVTYYGRAE
jgi:hypothetical protein